MSTADDVPEGWDHPEEGRPYPDPEHHSLAPRKPRTVGGAVYLVVLAATLVGLVIVVVDEWRTGLTVVGAANVAGGLARLVIPNDSAGMLGIRRKVIDVLTMVGVGAALIVLAVVIPEGPPPL
jgi:hypothetical protein